MKKILNLFTNQILKNIKPLFFTISFSFALLASLVAASFYSNESIKIFTRDLAATAELPFYTGYFSQLGGVLWIICSTTALFTACVVKNKYTNFLFFSGCFSLFLGN